MPTARRQQRESPTYIPLGIERDILVRMPPGLKSDVEFGLGQFRRLSSKRLTFASLARTAVSIGMDFVRQKHLGEGQHQLRLDDSLELEIANRAVLALRTQLAQLHEDLYRGLPSPGQGQLVCYCLGEGLRVIREKYLRPSPRGSRSVEGGPANV